MKRLHQDASPETLGCVRGWVFGLWLCKIAADPLHRLAELPASAFTPLGVWGVLPPSFWAWAHSEAFLTAFRIVTVLCLLAAFRGPCPKVSALLACVLLTFHQGYVRSFGYINHAELPLLYAAYALAAFPVADRFAAVPLTCVAAVLCFTYGLTGCYRLASGGLDAFRADTVIVWTLNDAHFSTYYQWTLGRDILEYPALVWAMKVGFPCVTLLELAAPLCLVCRPLRISFLVVMTGFHLSTWVLMNILFWENLALFPLLLNLDRWLAPRAATDNRPIVFFDGSSAPALRFVRWVCANDRTAMHRFSTFGGQAIRQLNSPDVAAAGPIVLWEGGRVRTRSDAILRVLSNLGGFGRAAELLRLLPSKLRDGLLAVVVKRGFGSAEASSPDASGRPGLFLP